MPSLRVASLVTLLHSVKGDSGVPALPSFLSLSELLAPPGGAPSGKGFWSARAGDANAVTSSANAQVTAARAWGERNSMGRLLRGAGRHQGTARGAGIAAMQIGR